MEPWMGALMDNLEVLTGTQEGGNWGRAATNDLLRNRIKIRSLNFMRGRTFLNRYLILDEAQNLTPKQMKALITRAGPGTKLACLGNIAQIDTPYLSEMTSGLTYAVNRFPWLAPFGAHYAGARRTFTTCGLRFGYPVAAIIACFVSFCNRRETEPGTHGRMRTMRRPILLLLIAGFLFATVAAAVEPIKSPEQTQLDAAAPQVPLTDLPGGVANSLPDLGSPEAAIISHSDERQLGYMIVQELRDQNGTPRRPRDQRIREHDR